MGNINLPKTRAEFRCYGSENSSFYSTCNSRCVTVHTNTIWYGIRAGHQYKYINTNNISKTRTTCITNWSRDELNSGFFFLGNRCLCIFISDICIYNKWLLPTDILWQILIRSILICCMKWIVGQYFVDAFSLFTVICYPYLFCLRKLNIGDMFVDW